MGFVRERVRLYGEEAELGVDALIDTRSSRVILPRHVAEELKVKPSRRAVVELADGSSREVDVGIVDLELLDRRAFDFAFIVENGEVCLGSETLETLGLAVDPTTGKVYPTRRFIWRI